MGSGPHGFFGAGLSPSGNNDASRRGDSQTIDSVTAHLQEVIRLVNGDVQLAFQILAAAQGTTTATGQPPAPTARAASPSYGYSRSRTSKFVELPDKNLSGVDSSA